MPDTCQRLAGKGGTHRCIYFHVRQSLALLKSFLNVEDAKGKLRNMFDKCQLSAMLELAAVTCSALLGLR